MVMASPPSEKMTAWLWKLLQECGIQKANVRTVYMLDEPPAGSGSRPLKAQIRQAWERFSGEIKESTPRVVIPMGGDALFSLAGIRETIFDARGYVITNEYFRPVEVDAYQQVGNYKTSNKTRGIKKGDPKYKWVKVGGTGLLGEDFAGTVIPTFTLDHVRMEAFAVRPAFKADLRRAAKAADGTLVLDDEGFGYYDDFGAWVHPYNGRELAKLNLWQAELGSLVAVDIETHGIDNEVIDRVSFSDGKRSASLEWSAETCEFLNRLFAAPDRTFAFHNSPFDVPRLIANGVKISQRVLDRRVIDTMWAAVILQPDLHKGLGRVAPIYLNVRPWKWRSLIDGDPIYYSAKDAYVTALLAAKLQGYLVQMGMWPLFSGEKHPGPGVMQTIPVLTEMSREGIALDRPYATKWVGRLERRLERYLKLWSRHFPTTSPRSTHDLQKLFYGEWKLPVHKTREDGITVDELACVKLRSYIQSDYAATFDEGPWRTDSRCTPRVFDLLLSIRDVAKTIKTYVQPVALADIGRVYPQYMPVAKDDEHEKRRTSRSKGNTATGRLASFGPNLQNQPKKVRRLYVPDKPHFAFVQADYKSAELFVMAYMAGDRRLQDDLKHDMHQRNADRFNTTRKTAKNVTYAAQYLAGPNKVSDMILEQEHVYIDSAECARLMEGMASFYTDVTAYKQLLITQCDVKHYIRNPFGRVRFFYDGAAPAAVNYIPQSTVADVLWCVLYDVAEMARQCGGRITTTVHDSILIQVPAHRVEQAARGMKTLMERPFDCVAPGFHIPVEIEVAPPGASWAEVKPFALA